MARIFGWTTGSAGLDRIRVTLPLEQLALQGHETSHGHIFAKEHGDSDVIIGCRIGLPDPSRTWARACGYYDGPFCVFETDDDNMNIAKWNRLKPLKHDESPLEYWSREDVRFHYVANARISHRIVTSTPYLAQLLYDQMGHPDIVVARNSIPGWMLDLPEIQQPDNPQDLVIAWAGGASHWGDWEWAKNGIRRGLVKSKVTQFRMVGQDFRKLLNFPTAHIPWFETVDDYWKSGLDGIHIGLAPLRPEPFNKSKSEIRLIEYGARGIPVIAQDYGPYTDYVEDGVTGLLVKTPKQWAEAIVELSQDPDLRLSMAKAARNQAKERTIERLWPEYQEAYTP